MRDRPYKVTEDCCSGQQSTDVHFLEQLLSVHQCSEQSLDSQWQLQHFHG